MEFHFANLDFCKMAIFNCVYSDILIIQTTKSYIPSKAYGASDLIN